MKWLRTIALILVLLQYARRVENCKRLFRSAARGAKSIAKVAIPGRVKYVPKAKVAIPGRVKGKAKARPSNVKKGRYEIFTKDTLELLDSMDPSVAFSPADDDNYDSEADYCFHCLSISRSDPKCENGTQSRKLCKPSSSNPYCSIEYGITSDYQRYVRRSCNAKLCQSCTPSLIDITGKQTSKCFPVQCQMCNSNNCNSEPVEEVFDDDWRGCTRDAESSGSIRFSETETCASWSSKSNALLVVLLSFSSLRFLERD